MSTQALRDAATICGLFTMIVRLADSFGWDVPSWEALLGRAPVLLEGRYALSSVGRR